MMLIFVGADWKMFFVQLGATGVDYFSWRRMAAPILNLFPPANGVTRLMAAEALFALAMSVALVKFAASKSARTHALRGIVMIVPYFIFGYAPALISGGVLFVLSLSADAALPQVSSRLSLTAKALVGAAAAIAVVKIGIIVTIAFLQHDGRDYSEVSRQLNRLVKPPGLAAIDQSAWLALRPNFGPGELHWLLPSEFTQIYMFRSMILRGPQAGGAFTYIVINRGRLPEMVRDYPGFRADIDAHRFREIGHVKPPFQSLPIARLAPYDLVVYKRVP
jgi:hypothetical protein